MNLGIFYILAAAIFTVLVIWDIKRKGKEMTPARKTWIIIAVVFALVGILNLAVF
jgi:hypothetical protein